MDNERFFELIMDVCDWDKSGDDDAVIAPLINFLSGLSDDEIYSFDDIMADLLYELDTKKNFKTACKYCENECKRTRYSGKTWKWYYNFDA